MSYMKFLPMLLVEDSCGFFLLSAEVGVFSLLYCFAPMPDTDVSNLGTVFASG